jgi:hypothetical protein
MCYNIVIYKINLNANCILFILYNNYAIYQIKLYITLGHDDNKLIKY